MASIAGTSSPFQVLSSSFTTLSASPLSLSISNKLPSRYPKLSSSSSPLSIKTACPCVTSSSVAVVTEDEDDKDCESENLVISELGLPRLLVDSLSKRGITQLFPIQRAVLVPALEGRDIIGRAKTGTGKTLAYGIPIITRLTQHTPISRGSGYLPRVLVLAPTRELAKQVEKELKESAPYLNSVCVYGGVSYSIQQNSLFRGVDVVVGTPGRIIDLIDSNSLRLGEIQFLVLDEADQMLDVGFEEDVETILENLPTKRQNMLFSATMPSWVKKLARKYLNNPLNIDLVGDKVEKLAEGIKLYAMPTTMSSRRAILSDLITVYAKGGKTIVFTQTKRDADEVSMSLTSSIVSEVLHGDISQPQRDRTLNNFRLGKFTVLVATDVAARGLDVPNVDLVIHYEVPNDPETFVHRSGRTGRAGKEGNAILLFSSTQKQTIRAIERDVGCCFEFINPPSIEDVLRSSAEQVVATLNGVHPDSVQFFHSTAERMFEQNGVASLASALAHLSGFSQPPSSRSLINHEQRWVTMQLIRDTDHSRGLSARSVTGFLSDVYPAAADEVGKIYFIDDPQIQGAVFDLPEGVAKELLAKQIPPGNTISKLTMLPALKDDSPSSDNYGRFSNSERTFQGGSRERGSSKRGSRERGGSRGSEGGGGGRFSDDEFQRGGRSYRTDYSWSQDSRSSGDDWLIGARLSSFRGQDRSFGGSCFSCGRVGHKSSECPNSRDR